MFKGAHFVFVFSMPQLCKLKKKKINYGEKVNSSTLNYTVCFITELSHFLFILIFLPVMSLWAPYSFIPDPFFVAYFKCHIFPLKWMSKTIVILKTNPLINLCWFKLIKLRWFFSFLLYLIELCIINTFTYMFVYICNMRNILIFKILSPKLNYEGLKDRRFVVYNIGIQKYLWLLH